MKQMEEQCEKYQEETLFFCYDNSALQALDLLTKLQK